LETKQKIKKEKVEIGGMKDSEIDVVENRETKIM
jgi:hypothetical protein